MITNDHKRIDNYKASPDRYNSSFYRRAGASGLKLPLLSLGLWHNFGDLDDLHNGRLILRKAFDLGITHFDLANNYGPPYGSAEINFGNIFKKDFTSYRSELVIATKAGYDMWDGPYGRGGSRKYLMNSIDESLKRMGLDYVDIFYHHVPDADTPIEETAEALLSIVQSGKALYIGISNYYDTEKAKKIIQYLKSKGHPPVLNQLRYSILDRRAEAFLSEDELASTGVIAFSPLEQGILAGKYLEGIPEGSRASKSYSYLSKDNAQSKKLEIAKSLNVIAKELNLSLSTFSLAWLLKSQRVSSVLIGASSPEQLEVNTKGIAAVSFSTEVLNQIDQICDESQK